MFAISTPAHSPSAPLGPQCAPLRIDDLHIKFTATETPGLIVSEAANANKMANRTYFS